MQLEARLIEWHHSSSPMKHGKKRKQTRRERISSKKRGWVRNLVRDLEWGMTYIPEIQDLIFNKRTKIKENCVYQVKLQWQACCENLPSDNNGTICRRITLQAFWRACGSKKADPTERRRRKEDSEKLTRASFPDNSACAFPFSKGGRDMITMGGKDLQRTLHYTKYQTRVRTRQSTKGRLKEKTRIRDKIVAREIVGDKMRSL